MDPQEAIDLSREAIRTCIFVGGPILLVVLVIGLLFSVFQAMTQLHDQAISFVPKILLVLVAFAICLPWLSEQMIDFARTSFEKPMLFEGVNAYQSVAPVANWQSESRSVSEVKSPRIRVADSQRDGARGIQAGFPFPTSTVEEEAESTPQPRMESPFLLPHYRYESDSPADPSSRQDATTDLEG